MRLKNNRILLALGLLVVILISFFTINKLLLDSPADSLTEEKKSLTSLDGVIYQEDYKNWRDNATDPGFNTYCEKQKNTVLIKTKADYGRAMSSKEPIVADITNETEIVVVVGKLDEEAKVVFNLVNAYEPYDSHQLAEIVQGNTKYTANINEITGWSGFSSFWLEVWLEGRNKAVVFNEIYLRDSNIKVKRKKALALKKYVQKKASSLPQDSVFFEDFRKGIKGWRTAESDPEFNSEINFESGLPEIKLLGQKGYGKIMSEAKGITAEITPNTQIEISLGSTGTSRVKLDLMLAHAPYTNYTLIPWRNKPGVYTANISEATSWQGNKKFWIQIWLEATTNVEPAEGAIVKYIKIYNKKN